MGRFKRVVFVQRETCFDSGSVKSMEKGWYVGGKCCRRERDERWWRRIREVRFAGTTTRNNKIVLVKK